MFLGSSLGDYVPHTQVTDMAVALRKQGVFVQTAIADGDCHSIQCKGKLIIATLGFLESELGVSAAERNVP